MTSSKPRLVEAMARESSRTSWASLSSRISERAVANSVSRGDGSGNVASTAGLIPRSTRAGRVAGARREASSACSSGNPRASCTPKRA
jgi:hypothetical protein